METIPLKIYGRRKFRIVSVAEKRRDEERRNWNLFGDSDEQTTFSPSHDPFDKLLKECKSFWPKEKEEKDSRSKDIWLPSLSPAKGKKKTRRKTVVEKEKNKTKKKKPERNEEYLDFTAIENHELLVEEKSDRNDSFFSVTASICLENKRRPKTEKGLTTSTPNKAAERRLRLCEVSDIAASPIPSNPDDEKPLMQLKQCEVILKRLSQSMLKEFNEKKPDIVVDSLCDNLEKLIPFQPTDLNRKEKCRSKRKKTVQISGKENDDNSVDECLSTRRVDSMCKNSSNEVKSLIASFKRSISPSFASVSKLIRRESKLLQISSDKKTTTQTNTSCSNCRMTSLLISLTPLDVSVYGNSVCGLRNVLAHCGQNQPSPFNNFIRNFKNVCKIGEGSYGEVFEATNVNRENVVLKIQALEEDAQLVFHSVWPEIVCSCRLSELDNDTNNSTMGFVRVNNITCLQGIYPQKLVKAWRLYAMNHSSESCNPTSYKTNQMYIGFESLNGGVQLEKFEFANRQQALSTFLQVASALAVAESALKFEHRDLHWSNILIAKTNEKHIRFKLNGKNSSIATYGVRATIIDFSLSRLEEDGCIVYNDLSVNPELFTGFGDYQFDIYRQMKRVIKNNWNEFCPYTNVLWLHYLIEKLCTAKKFKERNAARSTAGAKLLDWTRSLLHFSSAEEFVMANSQIFDQ